MYKLLRDFMSLVHYYFILVQKLISAKQENCEADLRESHKQPFRLSIASLQQLSSNIFKQFH